MSDSLSNFSFPHRTPVFTTVLVLACFALFGWLVWKIYTPQAYTVEMVAGVKTPADRKDLLEKNRKKEREESLGYAWLDQKAGVVRLPIDRAIELVAKEHAKK